jgi:hypothetical protein
MPPSLDEAVVGFRDRSSGRRIDDLEPGLVPVVRVPGEALGETRRRITWPDLVARQPLSEGVRRAGCHDEDKRKGSYSGGHITRTLDGKPAHWPCQGAYRLTRLNRSTQVRLFLPGARMTVPKVVRVGGQQTTE